MEGLPANRTVRSLERVWKHLAEAFDAAVKRGDDNGAPDLAEILRFDFAVRKDLPPADGVTVEDDAEPTSFNLSQLDGGDIESLQGIETMTNDIREMAKRIRSRMITSLAHVLIESSSHEPMMTSGWEERFRQINEALQGENAVLWLDSASHASLEGLLLNRENPLPTVTRRVFASYHRGSAALLFPLSPRFISRTETFPLELNWEVSSRPGWVFLHSWYRFQLHMTDRAKSMIINYPMPG